MASSVKRKVKSSPAFRFIGVLGALLVIVSFFLIWGSDTTTILGFSRTLEYSGMDFFERAMWVENTDAYNSWYNSIPLIALITACIALLLFLVPGRSFGGVRTERILGLVTVVIAVFLIILSIQFKVWIGGLAGNSSWVRGGLASRSVSTEMGAYLCLIGNIPIFIAGAIPMLRNGTG